MTTRKKLTLTVDEIILTRFRKTYHGSISSFLDGVMAVVIFEKNEMFIDMITRKDGSR